MVSFRGGKAALPAELPTAEAGPGTLRQEDRGAAQYQPEVQREEEDEEAGDGATSPVERHTTWLPRQLRYHHAVWLLRQ